MEGKLIPYVDGEYPELDGLKAGSEVKFSGAAVIEDGEEGKGLRIQSIDLETEGPATREMKKMRGENNQIEQKEYSPEDGEDF